MSPSDPGQAGRPSPSEPSRPLRSGAPDSQSALFYAASFSGTSFAMTIGSRQSLLTEQNLVQGRHVFDLGRAAKLDFPRPQWIGPVIGEIRRNAPHAPARASHAVSTTLPHFHSRSPAASPLHATSNLRTWPSPTSPRRPCASSADQPCLRASRSTRSSAIDTAVASSKTVPLKLAALTQTRPVCIISPSAACLQGVQRQAPFRKGAARHQQNGCDFLGCRYRDAG
jgi:hypothetical protein